MFHYLKRIHQLGFTQSITRIAPFMMHRWNQTINKIQYFNKKQITPSLKLFVDLTSTTPRTIFKASLFQDQMPTSWKPETLLALMRQNKAIIFSQTISLNDPEIWIKDPIHNNFLLPPCSPDQLPFGPTFSLDYAKKQGADIRIAFELGRLHHVSQLACSITTMAAEEKNEVTTYIMDHVKTWHDKNPYLHGPHWYNGMEVSIRATNIICIYQHLYDQKLLTDDDKKLLITLLYQHKQYIQTSWETSPTPNNHYLADLVGYLHLLLFFQVPYKTIQRWISTTQHAFLKQLLPDGWAYEGSTAYHKLATELLLHLSLISSLTQHPQKHQINQLYQKALTCLAQLQGPLTTMPLIGDNDSGKIVTGINRIKKEEKEKSYFHHFQNMGLTCVKQKNLYVTMRHSFFEKNRPTGHYHRDDLAITAALGEHPILVDPGSFLYSGNPKLRHHFRSWQSHNGLFCSDEAHQDLKQPLFQLHKKEWNLQPIIIHEAESIKIISKRPLYCADGIIMRTISIGTEAIEIKDQVISETKHDLHLHFTFDPAITLESKQGRWIIKKEDLCLAIFSSDVEFEIQDAFISPIFGTKISCLQLKATVSATMNELKITLLHRSKHQARPVLHY